MVGVVELELQVGVPVEAGKAFVQVLADEFGVSGEVGTNVFSHLDRGMGAVVHIDEGEGVEGGGRQHQAEHDYKFLRVVAEEQA